MSQLFWSLLEKAEKACPIFVLCCGLLSAEDKRG